MKTNIIIKSGSENRTLILQGSTLIFFIEMLVSYPYDYITTFPYAVQVLNAVRVCLIYIEILLLIVRHKENLYFMHRSVLLIFLFIAWQLVITLANASLSFMSSLYYPLSVFLTILITVRGMQTEVENFLDGIALYFWLAIIVNFISLIVFPNGLYTSVATSGNFHIEYFLGVDNQFGKFILPGVSLIWFRDNFKGNKFLSVTSILIMIITYIITFSGAGLFASVLFVIMSLMFILKKDSLISLRFLSVTWIIISILIIGGTGFLYTNKYTQYIVTELLGKNMTFSGRLSIWSIGVKKFLSNPFFGYGRTSSNVSIIIGRYGYSAHNIALQILIESGIIGFGFFIFSIISSGKVAACVEKYHREVKILYIGIFTTLIYFLMEVGNLIPFFMMVIILGMYSEGIHRYQ